MNQNAFDEGKAAYQRHDWEAAVNSLERVKGEGELCGEADHLLGNAYMQLREYVPASLAYNAALEDEAVAGTHLIEVSRGTPGALRGLRAAAFAGGSAPCTSA